MSFGTTIRKLRRDKEMTQEQLAEMLSISAQAVSRWENDSAMPDISLVMPLCHLFEITADELLGIDSQNTELRIAEFKKEMDSLYSQRKTDEMIALGYSMLKEYPGNFQVQKLLCFALVNQESPSENDLDEAISLTIDNLSKCTDETLRCSEIVCLARCYLRKGDKDNARKYANKLVNHFTQTAPYQLAKFGLVSGEEHISFFERYISELSDVMTEFIYHFAGANHESEEFCYSNARRIEILEKALSLLHLVYGKKLLDKNDEAYIYSRTIGCLYLLENDKENALKWFDKAADYAAEFSSYDSSNDRYDSVLATNIEPRKQNSCVCPLAEDFLNRIKYHGRYEAIKEDPGFIHIIERLKSVVNK